MTRAGPRRRPVTGSWTRRNPGSGRDGSRSDTAREACSRQASDPYRPPWTVQLCAVLFVGALVLSLVVTFVGAEQGRVRRVAELHARQQKIAERLASRAAPLLERGDELRLAVLAASTADIGGARVLMVDPAGQVRLDTGLTEGGRTVGLAAADRTVLHPLDGDTWEVVAPALGTAGFAGEVRLRYRTTAARLLTFPWSLFGLVLLCSLSLITVAGWMVHAWVARVAHIADHADRLARGERPVTAASEGGAVGAIQDALGRIGARDEQREREARDGSLRLAREVVHALELRGHVPAGHGERTRRWALKVADALGIDEATRRDTADAALVLDLGKAGVRPTALQKAAGLDPVERESLRQHPRRGASLLAALPSLLGVAEAVRHQHERWDGNGFPAGLRGERIPLSSRILAVASAYELLTNDSVHGPAMAWPDAIDRMREDCGEHFDPHVFDLFEQIVRRSPPEPQRSSRVVISRDGVAPYKVAEEDYADTWRHPEEEALEILAWGDDELEVLVDDGLQDD